MQRQYVFATGVLAFNVNVLVSQEILGTCPLERQATLGTPTLTESPGRHDRVDQPDDVEPPVSLRAVVARADLGELLRVDHHDAPLHPADLRSRQAPTSVLDQRQSKPLHRDPEIIGRDLLGRAWAA